MSPGKHQGSPGAPAASLWLRAGQVWRCCGCSVCLTAPVYKHWTFNMYFVHAEKWRVLNKSDIVMRVSGQHEVVSVEDAPRWDTGTKPYPEMPSQLSELWEGWCGAGKSHRLPQALILRGILAPKAGGCQGRHCGPRSRCGTPMPTPGPAGGCGVAETGGKELKGVSSWGLSLAIRVGANGERISLERKTRPWSALAAPPCCGETASGPYQGTACEGTPMHGPVPRRCAGGETIPGIVPPRGGRKQRGEGERGGPHHSGGVPPPAMTPRALWHRPPLPLPAPPPRGAPRSLAGLGSAGWLPARTRSS